MKYMLDHHQSFKIRFVNRLDMDTSGLIVVAKNAHSQADFMKQSQAGKVEKRYLALVKGWMTENEGTIDLPIGRPEGQVQREVMEDGQPSITHYTVVKRFDSGYTLVELLLETGRTHQIRVHLTHLGHPIVGDHLYGGGNAFLIERQALHAKYLSFRHPITGENLKLSAELPEDIKNLIAKL
jgi:23S rRNA pseudouridine1911/1915/1917 synthase